MNARRIAEKMLKPAQHGLGGDRVDRRRRVVIEVYAHGLIGHVNTAPITANPKQDKG
jgi:hypothetical protein